MEQETFDSDTFKEFTEQFNGIFLGSQGSVLFVNCPVRMSKTYTMIRKVYLGPFFTG